MDRTNDLFTLIGDLRADMNRQFDDVRGQFAGVRGEFAGVRAEFASVRGEFAGVRSEISGLRADADRRFEALDQKVDRGFRWLVGIQMTVMLTVIGLLVGTLYR